MASQQQFVHLHLHSAYSLLDGGNRIDRLIDRAKETGMTAVALTDHGNLHAAVEFYRKAKSAGIKPILGIEAYVAPDIDGVSDRTVRVHTGVADGGFHLVLLAETQAGWQNLLKLSSDAYLKGFYYKPRMDKSTLEKWSDGLIAINGHLGSSLAHHLFRHIQSKDEVHYQAAIDEARWHVQTFGRNEDGKPRFFIEVQRTGLPEQETLLPLLIRVARELDAPLVADNDAHFLLEEDYDAHDILCCISMGKTRNESQRLRYSRELYVKSPEQMAELFANDLPEALENTVRIADRCQVDLDFSQNHAPIVKIETKATTGEPPCPGVVGSTLWYQGFCARYELHPFDAQKDHESGEGLKKHGDDALRELAEAGAIWRYGPEGVTPQISARLDRELSILADKNISAYFLIVWDFVNEARRREISCMARGSAVGTMVGYCLGLSNACPIKHGLLFERFTDPDRYEYPDIDIDMCQDGRQAIIDYVRQKYGHVAQIITFSALKARQAIRDVGRVLDIPLPEVDKVCKLIGDDLGMTVDKALAREPDLRQLKESKPEYEEWIDIARRLEGMPRHAGVHAAGVVLATRPLEQIVPLYQPPNTNQLVTQWDGPTVESVGLLKMDFLGLRTLSIIEKARQFIRQTLDDREICLTVAASAEAPDPLDLDRIDFGDQRVLDLFRRGETASIFQFESAGMRDLLVAMKPDRLEDLIAANALYRPGPMQLIPDYNARKHGQQPVPRVHPIVDQFTAETYGIMVYQEQVMQIVHELGGIPLRAAYTLTRAISKKDRRVIDANRARFIESAQEEGLPSSQADELFELILKFAGYGFNKSHSTGYAIVAYQTSYLKTYFPVQYMAAVLSYESDNTAKIVRYVDECRKVLFPDGHRGIDVGAPDINRSGIGFAVVYDEGELHDANHGHIRFGLTAVKGVGEKAIRAIIQAREKDGPFQNLYEFCERVPPGAVNRATIEALIKCGAFDSIHGDERRSAMIEALDGAVQAGQQAAFDRDSGQLNFFETFAETLEESGKANAVASLPDLPPWTHGQQLQEEKAVLGFYLSSHPLNQHQAAVQQFSTHTIAEARELAAGVEVILGVMISRVRTTFTRKSKEKMAMLTAEDASGSIDAVLFPRTYAIAAPCLEPDQIVFLRGKVDRRREDPNIVVDQVIPVQQAATQLTQQVKIVLRGDDLPRLDNRLGYLHELLRGDTLVNGTVGAEVIFELHQEGRVVSMRVNGMRIRVNDDLPARIATVLDEADPFQCCQLIGSSRGRRLDMASSSRSSPISVQENELIAAAASK